MPDARLDEHMLSSLSYLLDRISISDLLARYCRGLDRQDVDLLKSIYHPDATETHGSFSGHYLDFIENYVPPLWECTQGVHTICNMTIDIDGDVARSETYAIVVIRAVKPEGDGEDTIMTARYLDRIERRNGGAWLIANRTVIFDWAHTMAFDQLPAFPPANYLRGCRGTKDPSYEALGLV